MPRGRAGGGTWYRQLQEEQTHRQIVAVQEKPFTFTDGVDLGLSEGGELLSLRGEPSCEESRLIGSKLIFKGSVELHALLRDADGTLRTARESMPFFSDHRSSWGRRGRGM